MLYGDLPCTEDIDRFIVVVNDSTKALDSISESELKDEIASISNDLSTINEALERCVWITRWQNKEDYDDTQRERAMTFSGALSYLVATNEVITRKKQNTEVDLELARYSYEKQAKMLNNAKH